MFLTYDTPLLSICGRQEDTTKAAAEDVMRFLKVEFVREIG